MAKRKNISDIIKLMEKEGFTYASGEYKNKYSKLLWINPEGIEVELSWHSIRSGYRNPPPKKNTHEDITEKAAKHGYKLLSTYENARKPMVWECPNRHQFESSWNRWSQRKVKCPYCVKKGKTKDQIEKEIEKLGYKLLSPYKNCHSYIKVLFQGKVYQTKWNWLRSGQRPEHKPEISIEEIQRIASSEGYILLSKQYQTNDSPLRWKCPKKHVYRQTWKTFKQGHRCPICGVDKTSGFSISNAENEIIDFLIDNGFRIEANNRSILEGRELDILIRSHNLAIEYCGLYWHSYESLSRKNKSIKETKEYHRNKRITCEEKGYRLLTFYSDEWGEKKPICQQMILSRLGVFQKKVHARKCVVREVAYNDIHNFFEQNHLMGSSKCKGIGLYYEGELVSLLGYKKTGMMIKIDRFASKLGYQVNGGFSRLIKKLPKCEKIQSFVDLRYGNGHSYEKIGFKRVGETLGWKWTNNRQTFNRMFCRANMDDRKLSQSEYAAEMKLYKIFDCGQAKYELEQ